MTPSTTTSRLGKKSSGRYQNAHPFAREHSRLTEFQEEMVRERRADPGKVEEYTRARVNRPGVGGRVGYVSAQGEFLSRSDAVINKSVNGVTGLMSAVTPNVPAMPERALERKKTVAGQRRGTVASRWNFTLFVPASADAASATAFSVKRQPHLPR